MSVRSTSTIIVGLFASWLLAAPAGAQLTTGAVTGTVKDAQGGVIPGATVVLISQTRGTALQPAFTNENGDFVMVNVAVDTYDVTVTMEGFKTLKRGPIQVSPGDRVGVGVLTIDVGGLAETIVVTGESPLVQTQSGERSFAVTTKSVENLPIMNRSFTALASLAPGMQGDTTNQMPRVGDRNSTGGGNGNIMMDGISTMDTGSNSILLQMNIESVAEVKVLVSGYQAEYGRSSGVQVTAVTKSGTNKFRGSAYSVFRNSEWYENSKTNILNGDPKALVNEKDLGYTIGGPIGKPGGSNKLFFFYSHEYAPRTGGGDTIRYRFPTALERAGDFSQTLDNNGRLYPYIKDPLLSGTCSATNQSACFAYQGVLGRIDPARLYQTGVNILKMYPMPNVTSANPYNYEEVRPEEHQTANQPAVRFDYLPTQKLRATFKYAGWSQKDEPILGTIPGWSDTRQYNPKVRTIAVNATYSLSSTTFLEATWGRAQNSLTGCALAQGGTGPSFCRAAFPMNDNAALGNVGLGSLPFIFPDAGIVNPAYFAYEALNGVNPPIWDGTRLSMVPSLSWGNRIANAPQNIPFPGYLNTNKTWDFSTSLTKVRGSHTLKGGFYTTHSLKAQQRQGWAGTINFQNDSANPLDSQFGYSNAALGIFSSYNQNSAYIEGNFAYTNIEGYLQDNWKVSDRLTLDFGMRLVHMQPQYDELLQASNFLPDKWSKAEAPHVYLAGCANGVYPCSGANRQAMDPRTGALLGANTVAAIGTLVPNSGNTLNALYVAGQGIAETAYVWPALVIGPRMGVAYDVTGQQKIILRGGAGLFFDRTSGNAVMNIIRNPPALQDATIRYATLQSMATGLKTQAPAALYPYEYDSKLPSTWTWNGGIQMMLPWATAIDVEYQGIHAYNLVDSPDINAVDFGAAFLPANQDRTLAASPIPGNTAVPTDAMRAFRGYGAVNQFWARWWNTSHQIQISLNRRFRNGLSFGFNDTILLQQKQNTGARLQHNADGTYSERADQAEADELLGNYVPTRHYLKGNFVWDMPDVPANGSTTKALGYVLNDWQLSGVWTANTGTAYTAGVSYANGSGNQQITGSPNYGGRVLLVGNTGSGCSSDPLRQLNAAGFAPPPVGSVGLESGADYLRGCFYSVIDMSLAKNIRLGGSRSLQFRVDIFNVPNAAAVTGRNTTMQVQSPIDPTQTNLPYDAQGNVVAARSLPKNAGFGVANAYQNPRRIQLQVRFAF